MSLPGRVMVDCSHANSGKNHEVQVDVAREVAGQIAAGRHHVFGVMLESFLEDGNQKHDESRPGSLVYGQSITDACMGWDRTSGVLDELAFAVQKRRG